MTSSPLCSKCSSKPPASSPRPKGSFLPPCLSAGWVAEAAAPSWPQDPCPFTSWLQKTQLLTHLPAPTVPLQAEGPLRLPHLKQLIQSL